MFRMSCIALIAIVVIEWVAQEKGQQKVSKDKETNRELNMKLTENKCGRLSGWSCGCGIGV